MKKVIIIWFIGFLISWVFIAGMSNADLRATFPNLDQREMRHNLGFSVAWGACASVLWPITLPLVYCFFGFAQDGWTLEGI